MLTKLPKYSDELLDSAVDTSHVGGGGGGGVQPQKTQKTQN